MKLLFIFTGGTIGSTFDGEYISTDSKKPYSLIEAYKLKFGINFEYETIQPYTELSENNTGETLSNLCKCAKENSIKDYDGIIITHGTDTLQYSAAALGYCLGNQCIPICIVSSNQPIENENANGLYNLHGAIKLIGSSNVKGVWVIYKNPHENITIHRATRLIASQPYSDCFYSVLNNYYGQFDNDYTLIPNNNFSEHCDQTNVFNTINFDLQCNEILRIEPYTGMIYPHIDNRIKYIIHGTFHSGTLNTKSDYAKAFYKEAKLSGKKIYLTGISSNESYSSTKDFENLGLMPLPNASPIAMYIKLWLCIISNQNPDDILFKSLGGDILY